MKAWVRNQMDDLGIMGMVLYFTLFISLSITAVWLAEPFLSAVTGITSFVILSVIYLFVLALVSFPVMLVAGFAGNVLGLLAEGIAALYRYYAKRV